VLFSEDQLAAYRNAREALLSAALTVAVEKLVDARLFLNDFVRWPCPLYELFLGRNLVEHVFRRRAVNFRELRRWRDVRAPRRIVRAGHTAIVALCGPPSA
jgi:hypothetical protein